MDVFECVVHAVTHLIVPSRRNLRLRGALLLRSGSDSHKQSPIRGIEIPSGVLVNLHQLALT